MFAASKSGQKVTAADTNFKNVLLLLQSTTTNGQQNNTFLDSSSNNFTITRNGTPTQGSVTPYWPNGYWSNYFSSSSALYNASVSSMNFGASTNFTIEAFVNWAAAASGNETYFELTGTTRMILGRSTTGFRAYWNGTEKGAAYTFVTSNWYHIAVVRNSGTVSFYINGSLLTSFTDTITWASSRFNIGMNSDTAEPMTGNVSNLRVVNGTAVYTSAFTPPTTPLTAITNTSLLTCQSNRFRDGSTNNFAITVTGTPRVQPFQPFTPIASYTPATYGGGGYFNGTTDYLSISAPNSGVLDVSGGSNFTIEAWFYATNTTSMNIWARGGTNGTQNSQYWANLNTGTLQWGIGNGGTGAAINSITGVQYNCWNHFAVVLVSTTFTPYLNGVAYATAALTFTIPTTINNPTLWIGAAADTSPRLWFYGYITGFRLVKGTAVYTAAFTPPTALLTAITNTSILLNFANAGIYDASVQTNYITVSSAQASTTVAKWSPTSMKFNGTTDYLQSPYQPQFQLGTANFTIEFWVYFNSVGANQRVAGQDNNTSTLTWAIYTTVASRLDYYLSSTGTSWNIALGISMGSIAISTWYYVALVRNGSTFTPYINSVAGTATTNAAALFASTSPITIGASGIATTFFNGYIQDFRITRGIARTITTPTASFPTR